jgi:HK97 family phage prohead protease
MRFAGYAALFDRVDQGSDVVRPGAFAATLKRGAAPLLWEHRGAPIGRIEALREDRRGLRVIGEVTDKRAAALVGSGKVTGLSFGYRVRAAGPPARKGGPRELTELELVEISLVNFPMQPLARIHAVASVTR